MPFGNVGIGTTNPGQKLDVVGNIKGQIIESTSGGVKFPDGTIQTSAATGVSSMDWSSVTNKPAGFADNVDNDTPVTKVLPYISVPPQDVLAKGNYLLIQYVATDMMVIINGSAVVVKT